VKKIQKSPLAAVAILPILIPPMNMALMASEFLMVEGLDILTTLMNLVDLTGNEKAVKEKFPLWLFFVTITERNLRMVQNERIKSYGSL
jgi:hypothetical protein